MLYLIGAAHWSSQVQPTRSKVISEDVHAVQSNELAAMSVLSIPRQGQRDFNLAGNVPIIP